MHTFHTWHLVKRDAKLLTGMATSERATAYGESWTSRTETVIATSYRRLAIQTIWGIRRSVFTVRTTHYPRSCTSSERRHEKYMLCAYIDVVPIAIVTSKNSVVQKTKQPQTYALDHMVTGIGLFKAKEST